MIIGEVIVDFNSVSLIIPAYNEEKAIGKILDDLKSLNDKYEIIVVDDGSEDDTAKIVKTYSNVKLISHEINSGYGATLKTGIKHAAGDVIIITDADGTYPNERIPELIQIFEEGNYDMVVGARIGDNVKIPTIRKPAKWFINKLANYLSGSKIPDLNSGLRLMRKSVLEKYMRLLPNGFSFTSTITMAMITNQYSVKFVPIDYFERSGKSKIRPIHDTLNFIQLIIRMAMYFDPLKIFLPLSLPLIVIGFFLMVFHVIYYQNITTLSVIVSMTGIELLAIGMLADLIDKRTL